MIMKKIIYIFSFVSGFGIQKNSLPFFDIYGDFVILDILIIGSLGIYLLNHKKHKINRYAFRLSILFLLFTFWNFVSFYFSNYDSTLKNLGPLLRYSYYSYLIYVLSVIVNDKESIIKMINYFLIGMLFNSIRVYYLWFLEPSHLYNNFIFNNSHISRNMFYYYNVF
ncbi:MAG: hypothetical protein ACOCQA_04035, partial [bacterium]